MTIDQVANNNTTRNNFISHEVTPELEPLSWQFWRKRRYIVVIMSFFGFFNVFSLRVNLSVGIVAMTENRTIYNENGDIIGYDQYFPWTSTEQGLVLSSFFYGYILTQFLGGYFGAKFGGNWVFGTGIGITAILTLLTPMAAKSSLTALIIVRVIKGTAEGVTFPCIHAIWSKWAPPKERSRMASTAFTGIYAGTVVAMSVSGLLANAYGWESLFYVFGTIGVIWYILWLIIVREGPEKDRFISNDELRYINESLQKQTTGKEELIYPWKAIFTSPAVYAICFSHFADNWGFFTLVTHLPTFLKDILHYDLQDAGFLSAAPFLALGILLFIAGYLADYIQIKGWLTTTQVRKYFNCIAFIAQAIFMLAAAFLLHPIWSIVAIIIAVALGGFVWCGFAVNHLDIAPQYASVLMGISGTFAIIPGIVSPTLTGVIVQNKLEEEWRIVFFISAGIYLIGCIVYWFWASGEVQPWAKLPLKYPEDIVENESNYVENNEQNVKIGHINSGNSDMKQ